MLYERLAHMTQRQFDNSYTQHMVDDKTAKKVAFKTSQYIPMDEDGIELLISDIKNLRANEWFEEFYSYLGIEELKDIGYIELFDVENSPFTTDKKGDYVLLYENAPDETQYIICETEEEANSLLKQYEDCYNHCRVCNIYEL